MDPLKTRGLNPLPSDLRHFRNRRPIAETVIRHRISERLHPLKETRQIERKRKLLAWQSARGGPIHNLARASCTGQKIKRA